TLSIEVAGSQSPSNFVLELRDPDGRLVAILGGGMQSACLAIPAGEGQYELTIGAFDPLVEETFTVTLRQAECASAPLSPASPSGAPQPQQVPVSPQQPASPAGGQGSLAAACSASSASNVNIRSGPGTNYEIVGQLFAGQEIEV